MSSVGSDLCRACGLCCDGTLFGALRVGDDEEASVQRARLPIHRDDQGAAMRLPCTAHAGACTVYDDRPAICRSYRCDLLHHLEIGETTLEDALSRVAGVRAMVAALRPLLPGREWLWSEMAALVDRPLEWRVEHADRLLVAARLAETLKRFFDRRSGPQLARLTR